MRELLAFLLILVLVWPLPAQGTTPTAKEQVIAISRGSAVEVRLLDGSKLRGSMGAVSDSGFELYTGTQGKQDVAFERVKSVKDRTAKSFGRSLGRGYIVGIIVVVVIGVTFGILCREGCWG